MAIIIQGYTVYIYRDILQLATFKALSNTNTVMERFDGETIKSNGS